MLSLRSQELLRTVGQHADGLAAAVPAVAMTKFLKKAPTHSEQKTMSLLMLGAGSTLGLVSLIPSLKEKRSPFFANIGWGIAVAGAYCLIDNPER